MREDEGYQRGGYESLERKRAVVRGGQMEQDLNT